MKGNSMNGQKSVNSNPSRWSRFFLKCIKIKTLSEMRWQRFQKILNLNYKKILFRLRLSLLRQLKLKIQPSLHSKQKIETWLRQFLCIIGKTKNTSKVISQNSIVLRFVFLLRLDVQWSVFFAWQESSDLKKTLLEKKLSLRFFLLMPMLKRGLGKRRMEPIMQSEMWYLWGWGSHFSIMIIWENR